jgi:outer membrane lipoprotein-sorting protein
MVSVCAGCLLSLIALARPSPLSAETGPMAPAERDAYIARFTARQQQTETWRAVLKHTLRLRGLRQPVESDGEIFYRRPDALAIHFRRPAGEFLILNGRDAWLKKSRQPLRHRALDPREPGNAEWTFLLSLFRDGAADTHERFHIEITRADNHLLVTLVPRQPPRPRSRAPVRIENEVDPDTLELRRLRLHFDNDNLITYEFSRPVRNEPIGPSVFDPARMGD